MATAPQTVRPAPTPTQELYVEDQLHRARQRIRRLDTIASLLGFGSLTLAYGLLMLVLDRWLTLPAVARLAGLGFYTLGAAAYLWFTLVRPLLRPINPYYAARKLEGVMPGAKNSVVNWLDLREQKLPGAIRNAVSARAAKDVARADIDTAISGQRVGRLGGVAGTLFVAGIVFLVVCQPSQFFSLLRRAFIPFVEGAVATRTTVVIHQPVTPIATVMLNQPVAFEIELGGREPRVGQPDTPRLHFRYSQAEPVFQERPLEVGDQPHTWVFRLPGFEVHNGFFFYLTAGDVQTPEYQVRAVSGPLVSSFEVDYKYRPYLARADFKTNNPNLEGLCGTTITLVAHTNRTVRDGQLQIFGDNQQPIGPPVVSQPVTGDPEALQFQFVLDAGSTYRLRFTSVDGEPSNDSVPYNIKFFHDQPPQVELKKPADDVSLPANGVLPLEGLASDDFGITGLTLRLQIEGGQKLPPRPYRLEDKKSFKFTDGTYPRTLNYYDVLDLSKIQDAAGRAVTLKPGQVVEYWLEAADNCDYPQPGPNVGRTRSYKIKVAPPEDPRKNQEQRNQAEKQAQDQQKQQDQQHAQQQQEKNERTAQPRRRPGGTPDESDQNPKNVEKAPSPEAGDHGSEKQPLTPEEQKKAEDIKTKAKELQKQLDKHQGEAKGDEKTAGGEKTTDPNTPDNPENKKAEQKPAPKPEKGPGNDDQKPADSKPQDKKDTGGDKQGGNKGAEQPPADSAASKKEGPASLGDGNQQGAAENKPTAKPDAKPGDDKKPGRGGNDDAGHAGEKKPEPKPGAGQEAAADNKPATPPPGQEKSEHAATKPNGGGNGNESKAAGNARDNPKGGDRREASREQVKGLADQLKSKETDQREKAARDLEDIARHGADPQAQKDAHDALEKSGLPAPQPKRDSGTGQPDNHPKNGGEHAKPPTPQELQKALDKARQENPGKFGQELDKMTPGQMNDLAQKIADDLKQQQKEAKPAPTGDKPKPPTDEDLRKAGLNREQFDKLAKAVDDKLKPQGGNAGQAGAPNPQEMKKELEKARQENPGKFGKDLDKLSPQQFDELADKIAQDRKQQQKDGKPAPGGDKPKPPSDEDLRQAGLNRQQYDKLAKAVDDKMKPQGGNAGAPNPRDIQKEVEKARQENPGKFGKDVDKLTPEQFDDLVQKITDDLKAQQGKPGPKDNSMAKDNPQPTDEELRKAGLNREQLERLARAIQEKMAQPTPREVEQGVEKARNDNPGTFGKDLDKMTPDEKEQLVQKIADEIKKQKKQGKRQPPEQQKQPTDAELAKQGLDRKKTDELAKAIANKMMQPGQDGRDDESPPERLPPPDEGEDKRDPVNDAARDRPGDLTLEVLKGKVTDKDLKELNMTRAEYERFLKDYQEMLKRQRRDTVPPETLPAAASGNRPGTTTSPRVFQPTAREKTDPLQNVGPGQPPPGYRSSYEEFSQRLSQVKPPADKK